MYLVTYFEDAERTKRVLGETYASYARAIIAINEEYARWLRVGGDECGYDEWRKDYEIWSLT